MADTMGPVSGRLRGTAIKFHPSEHSRKNFTPAVLPVRITDFWGSELSELTIWSAGSIQIQELRQM